MVTRTSVVRVRARRGFLWLTACLLLAGCPAQRVNFHPANVPPQETATISAEFERFGLQIILQEIDGVDIPGVAPGTGGVYSRETEAVVLPGRHTVRFSVWGVSLVSEKPIDLTFDAVAGRHYRVRAGPAPDPEGSRWGSAFKAALGAGDQQWVFWIVDRDSGAKVPLIRPDTPWSDVVR